MTAQEKKDMAFGGLLTVLIILLALVIWWPVL